MQAVRINIEKCREISCLLKGLDLNSKFLSRPFLTEPMEKETRLRMLLFSVAICHQTHTLRNERLNLTGWEYMEEVFLRIVKNSEEYIDSDYLTKLSPEGIGDFLLKSFSDDNTVVSSTLDRIDERIRLYLDTAENLLRKYGGSVDSLLEKSENHLLHKGKGFYELLDSFKAFSDPLRKKSTFFLKLASDSGLFTPQDPGNIIPIMDYHMQRIVLRTGCVEIRDMVLAEKLRNRVPVECDREIREACIDALYMIAIESGHSILSMNDIFWPLGRSCCHETCLCQVGYCQKQPCTLSKTILLHEHGKCILDESCEGKSGSNYRGLWQPVVKTHFY